ncbi:MAG TPA: CopD family protein [Bacteroidia bacterium]|nr:CopD family protein [Bacteroidia bacterium]
MNHSIYITSVFFHIVAACLWLGGMLFLILAFVPGIKKHPDKVNLIATVSLKYRKVGTLALVVLLITGIIQLEYRGVQWNLEYFTSSYGMIAGLKILVFILIVCISLIHDYYIGTRAIEAWKNQPDNPKTIVLRNLSRLLGRLSFVLALIAVFLGVVLVRGW